MFERQSPRLAVQFQDAADGGVGMFGGRFGSSIPDTQASAPLTERDSRKLALKDEIRRCMRQLDFDENNNPNNATTCTSKTDQHRPPVDSRLPNRKLPSNGTRSSIEMQPP